MLVGSLLEGRARAGCGFVFIGLESINPDNLVHMKKNQNRILEYRDMLLQWKKHPVVITAGYALFQAANNTAVMTGSFMLSK
mgnify:CR=1 FL=1